MPGRGPWAQARLLSLNDSGEGSLVCGRGQRHDRVTWMEMPGSKQPGTEKAREVRKTWREAGSSVGALALLCLWEVWFSVAPHCGMGRV